MLEMYPGDIWRLKKSFGRANFMSPMALYAACDGCPCSFVDCAGCEVEHAVGIGGFFEEKAGREILSPMAVQKFDHVELVVLLGLVGPKNPRSAPVSMSIPSMEGTGSGVSIIHVGTLLVLSAALMR